jgi:poly-gamma-glutamate synthesis protein (capsule biosynthesis protein)
MAAAGAAALLTATTACGPLAGVADGGGKHPFTVAFGGDVHFEGDLRARLDADPKTVFGPVGRQLSGADLAIVNLETAVTTGGTPAPKQFTFRAPPTAFTALRAAGVDVATMANNHGMDYGATGLRDSLTAARQAGFPVVGIGANAAAAYRPYLTTVNGTKVAIIGATQVLDDELATAWTATDTQPGLASAKDEVRLDRAVRQAQEANDIVIVDLHWGQELNSCPTDAQQRLADHLLQSGADAIIGSHAHVVLAGGYYKHGYVDYGLGNFLFYNANGRTAQSGVLTLTFDAAAKRSTVTKAVWAPARLENGVARPLTGPAAQEAQTSWLGLRRCAGLTASPTS